MKIQRHFERLSIVATLGSIILASCNKDFSGSSSSTSESSTIAVAASLSAAAAGVSTDSVYILSTLLTWVKEGFHCESALPANVTSYLIANYEGSTFKKAFAIVNSIGTTTGYVVVIYYNDNPVGIEFNSAGEFVKTLEQREKVDLDGKGWHRGGRFETRGGFGKDTIALNALPSAILTYFSGNYSGDTLVKAFVGKDPSYLILSRNNGLFATVFDASGNFVKRVQLPSKEGNCSTVDQSALPAVTLAYLGETYPNYVFEKAFAIKLNGTLQAYVVVIDANNTKYALEFDGAGNFLRVKTIS